MRVFRSQQAVIGPSRDGRTKIIKSGLAVCLWWTATSNPFFCHKNKHWFVVPVVNRELTRTQRKNLTLLIRNISPDTTISDTPCDIPRAASERLSSRRQRTCVIRYPIVAVDGSTLLNKNLTIYHTEQCAFNDLNKCLSLAERNRFILPP